ncbi:MAG: DUF4115 domain-containing protein [Ignavibacteriales bacterium]|nr:DUF4115 domain-containing protein [Ignavibacteriales bacterium]
MKSAGELLRKAREEQNRSLDDVASAVKISKNFLQEIENGKMPNVPGTYVRAFLRDYAIELGLKPEDVFREISKDPELVKILDLKNVSSSASLNVSERVAPNVHVELKKKKKTHQYQIVMVITVFIFTGLALSIFFFRENKISSNVKEISFNEMLKDKEHPPSPAAQIQESSGITSPKSIAVIPDTLVLEGVASESVWVRITSDGKNISETIIPPFVRKKWFAKEEFLISIGNGAAITFTFNGQKIGAFSITRKPVKNLILSPKTIEKILPSNIKQAAP